METTELINNLLDTINRPNDTVWSDRVKKFIQQSFNRLGQKLLYEPLDIKVESITLPAPIEEGDLVIKIIKNAPFVQNIYSSKQKLFMSIEFMNNLSHDGIDVKKVLRVGNIYYFNPSLANTDVYFFYTNQIKSPEENENLTELGEMMFKQSYDFLYYDCLVKLYTLLNIETDRISMVKGLRDEAYVDLTSWANALNYRANLNIKG